MSVNCRISVFLIEIIIILDVSDRHLFCPIMKAALLSIVTLAIAIISLAEAQVPPGQPGPGVPVNPGYGAPGYGYGAPPPKVEILRIVSSLVF